MEKIGVGILGATGMVGQKYIHLLENHPWFEVTYVAASPRSAGKKFAEAVEGRWLVGTNLSNKIANFIVEDAANVEKAKGKCTFVFSAVELASKKDIQDLENAYAAAGIPVVSNASAHRWTENVPMLIPEINANHLEVIEAQKKTHGWNKGFVAVKCVCDSTSLYEMTDRNCFRLSLFYCEEMRNDDVLNTAAAGDHMLKVSINIHFG